MSRKNEKNTLGIQNQSEYSLKTLEVARHRKRKRHIGILGKKSFNSKLRNVKLLGVLKIIASLRINVSLVSFFGGWI